jgi:glycosyltransferase involved in cell wall biosynthesis
MEYSVIIPVYNEEENVEPLLKRLDETLPSFGGDYEIIFVDDGSTDRSAEMIAARAAKDGRVRLIRFERNCGQSAGFDAGFKAARGKIFITMDSDLQNDPGEIAKLLPHLNDHDAASGWRVKRQDTILKRISTKIANWVRNKLSGEKVHDSACSLRAIKRDAALSIRWFNGAHRFVPTLLKLEGFTVAEVPVKHFPRTRGKTKYGVWNRVFRALYDLMGVRWLKNRHLNYKIKEG